MKVLLDPLEKRALAFLYALYTEERWWTEKELSTIGNCSANTTYRTINHLKAFSLKLDSKFIIITKKNKGIFLKTSSFHSIGEIEADFLKDSVSYQLIDLIFQQKGLTTQLLTEKLYLSPSTVYRKLKQIRHFFSKNGLKFDLNSLLVAGPEHLIREFYYRFYWSVIKSTKWPFKIPTFITVSEMFKQKEPMMALKLSEIEQIQFLYRLAINQIRHHEQHFFTEPPDKQILDPHFQRYSTDMKLFIPVTTPSEFLENEWSFLALVLVSNPVFEEQHGDYQMKISWHKEKQTLPYSFSKKILHTFLTLYPAVTKQHQEKILYKLLCVYLSLIIFADLQLTHSNSQDFMEKFELENPNFFNRIKQMMDDLWYLFPKEANPHIQNYLLYHILLILSTSIDINHLKSQIHIKLICHIEPLSEEYLKQRLIKQSSHHLVVNTSTSEETKDRQFDLLLSDIYLPSHLSQKATNYYIWDFPPTERDWQNIFQTIDKITSTRESVS
ncbi:helix-turn-helix domain-containing protein [Vagococcus sp. BWB3-3]|uniref:Helix-turn-helix domain-containing protein n=1 Tax=Vagococcus allomyrinae TaxID=2794353 RepID=A0A940P8Q4_9ENTE|nr:helix-turn-helix domain-containing protein [Vagococcus allomyrinae]MBP1040007.1 helix-turn-helix domain-containing protein [Vagococcus allomyrinae]